MALDYRKCAQEISDHIGGGSNLVSATHCQTRIRLQIRDYEKVDKDGLEEIEGVRGMFESGGFLQLIIGTGLVGKVFDEFASITGIDPGTDREARSGGTGYGSQVLSSLIAGLAGGLAGALITVFAGLGSIGAAGDPPASNPVVYVIAFVICFVIVFIIAWILQKRKRLKS